ncbi:hypothetical protein F4561_004361 [Lipingzhangella halophila]|uniref:Uncharacterized protein n=1 Tax=Lipingzhangella halophila TaxID=1783352 RepID=A0A7W7W484_9ACTN|nr:hypothetical protein [Lipingzhangella halophila]
MPRRAGHGADLVAGGESRAAFDPGPDRDIGGAQRTVPDAHGGGPGDTAGERHASRSGGADRIAGFGREVDSAVAGQPPLLRGSEFPDDLRFTGEWPAPRAFVGQGGGTDRERRYEWDEQDDQKARSAPPKRTRFHGIEPGLAGLPAPTRIVRLWTVRPGGANAADQCGAARCRPTIRPMCLTHNWDTE